MAWLRVGDNVSTHPKMFQLLEACDYDHALKNAAFGALVIAASVSAAHLTDYVVEQGLVATFAPTQTREIITALTRVGLLAPVEVEGRTMWRLFEDPEFIHMRSKDEVEIDRRRKSDLRDQSLIIPVRVRDGDICRWCDRTVNFADRKGARGGTIDSLTRHIDSTVDSLVVACRGCNSKRREGVEMKLGPAPDPKEVFYTPATIAYINGSDYAQQHGIHLVEKQLRLNIPGSQAAAPAPSYDQAAAAPGQAAPAGDRSGSAAPATAGNRIQAAAATKQAAPDLRPAGDDPLEEAPDWVTMSLEEIRQQRVQAAAPAPSYDQAAAAPGQAAPAGDRSGSAAPDEPAAPTPPPANITECNETVKPGPDPDHEGDGSGNAGTGRDGTGRSRAGKGRSGSARRRSRGRRSGRKR